MLGMPGFSIDLLMHVFAQIESRDCQSEQRI
jgi:hypothetical protein